MKSVRTLHSSSGLPLISAAAVTNSGGHRLLFPHSPLTVHYYYHTEFLYSPSINNISWFTVHRVLPVMFYLAAALNGYETIKELRPRKGRTWLLCVVNASLFDPLPVHPCHDWFI